MKKFLFLFIIAFQILFLSNESIASSCLDETKPTQGRFYTSLYGGGDFILTNQFNISKVDGVLGSFAIGYDFKPMRIEAEVAYSWNIVSGDRYTKYTIFDWIFTHSYVTKERFHSRLGIFYGMFNVYRDFYDLSDNSCLVPYIGFGIGYCRVNDKKQSLGNDKKQEGVALDGIIGLKTKLTEKVDLAFEFRQYVVNVALAEYSVGMKLTHSF